MIISWKPRNIRIKLLLLILLLLLLLLMLLLLLLLLLLYYPIGTRPQREMPASTRQIMQATTYNNLHATSAVETFQLFSINKLFVSYMEIKILSLFFGICRQ